MKNEWVSYTCTNESNVVYEIHYNVRTMQVEVDKVMPPYNDRLRVATLISFKPISKEGLHAFVDIVDDCLEGKYADLGNTK